MTPQVAGTVGRGSLVVVTLPEDYLPDADLVDLARIHDYIAHSVGHGQFGVVGVFGNTDVLVIGPESIGDVLGNLSAIQLAQLAGVPT